ncbi:MAG TPA: hypothetical protein VKZ97_09240 [Flavobacteriaceae bacterium]|nr:hypothetical protein [Flavobacteriaceae bacterium]
MKLQNIIKIIVLIIGVIAAFFFIRIMSIGDDVIEVDVAKQSIVGSFITLALITLAIAAIITLVFTLINLVMHPEKLKQALISIALFAVVVAIAYFTSSEWMPEGSEISTGGAKWIEAGLKAFYFLVIVAVGAMLWGGIKKLTSK